jgi:hypothetical protein
MLLVYNRLDSLTFTYVANMPLTIVTSTQPNYYLEEILPFILQFCIGDTYFSLVELLQNILIRRLLKRDLPLFSILLLVAR